MIVQSFNGQLLCNPQIAKQTLDVIDEVQHMCGKVTL